MKTKKLKVGHNFYETVKENFKEDEINQQVEIGESGYYIVTTKEDLFFVGKRLFNVSKLPITFVEIIPIVKEICKKDSDNKQSLYNTFNIENKKVYYSVSFKFNEDENYAYIFNKLEDAFQMCHVYLEFKAMALRVSQ